MCDAKYTDESSHHDFLNHIPIDDKWRQKACEASYIFDDNGIHCYFQRKKAVIFLI